MIIVLWWRIQIRTSQMKIHMSPGLGVGGSLNAEHLHSLPLESGLVTLLAVWCICQPGSFIKPQWLMFLLGFNYVDVRDSFIGCVIESHSLVSFPSLVGFKARYLLVTWLIFLVTRSHPESSCQHQLSGVIQQGHE